MKTEGRFVASAPVSRSRYRAGPLPNRAALGTKGRHACWCAAPRRPPDDHVDLPQRNRGPFPGSRRPRTLAEGYWSRRQAVLGALARGLGPVSSLGGTPPGSPATGRGQPLSRASGAATSMGPAPAATFKTSAEVPVAQLGRSGRRQRLRKNFATTGRRVPAGAGPPTPAPTRPRGLAPRHPVFPRRRCSRGLPCAPGGPVSSPPGTVPLLPGVNTETHSPPFHVPLRTRSASNLPPRF